MAPLSSAATLLLLLVLLATPASMDTAGWCHWLPWTCATARSAYPLGFGGGGSPTTERVECSLRRARSCCNAEPPNPAATSCPGGSSDSGYEGEGGELWHSGASYDGMSCPSALAPIGWKIVPYGQAVNACLTDYPRFESRRGVPAAWCPWEYWASWQYPEAASCRGQRLRQRRCDCPSPSAASSRRTRGGRDRRPPSTCSSAGSSEAQHRDDGCSAWCGWSAWGVAAYLGAAATAAAPEATAPRWPVWQRRRDCACGGGGSGGSTTAAGSSSGWCRPGQLEVASRFANNATSSSDDDDLSSPQIAAVVGGLAVLVAGAAALTAVAVVLLLCKRARRPRGSHRRPWSAAAAVAHFPGVVIADHGAVPSAPAYGSAAFFQTPISADSAAPAAAAAAAAASPIPTVSLKVDDGGFVGEAPPPPYTSQPDLRTTSSLSSSAAAADASGDLPPPPYEPTTAASEDPQP